MILRRYGHTLHSVRPNFDSKAMTEIGFRRDQERSLPVSELGEQYQLVETLDLSSQADGYVHDEVEQALLADLESQLKALEARLGDDEVLVVESEQGVDYPKTRSEQKNEVIQGENKIHFYVNVHPPLRIGRYRRSA